MPDNEIKTDFGASISEITCDFEIDKTVPCKYGLGDIDTCKMRREGRMFPHCGIGDVGENRCSQVIVIPKLS